MQWAAPATARDCSVWPRRVQHEDPPPPAAGVRRVRGAGAGYYTVLYCTVLYCIAGAGPLLRQLQLLRGVSRHLRPPQPEVATNAATKTCDDHFLVSKWSICKS